MTDYVKKLRAKGWKAKEIAERWGVTTRMISYIAANPSRRDLDALAGVPERGENR